MANKFQSHTLKKRFKANNDEGTDLVDFDGVTEKGGSYDENLENLRQEYPGFNWKGKEDYGQYARDHLKSEALKMGLTVTVRADSTPKRETPLNDFYEQIAQDVQQTLILLLSERGHGKSSSLKTIVQYIKSKHPGIVWKVFDPSLSWYKTAPLRYRQLVTMDKIAKGQVANVEDCVYEIGALNEAERRGFIATVIGLDYKLRYNIELKGVNHQPFIVYIVEEANTIFNPYSFRRNDAFTPILQDFVSISRNLKMSSIMVSTAETGELSPSIRRRRRIIYGRVTSPSDLQEAKRYSKTLEHQVKNQPRFSFTYQGKTCKIPDTCTSIPEDYTVKQDTPQTQTTKRNLWLEFTLGAIMGLMLILYLRGI